MPYPLAKSKKKKGGAQWGGINLGAGNHQPRQLGGRRIFFLTVAAGRGEGVEGGTKFPSGGGGTPGPAGGKGGGGPRGLPFYFPPWGNGFV